MSQSLSEGHLLIKGVNAVVEGLMRWQLHITCQTE